MFEQPGVSRQHARVFERNGAHYAEDLGSVNGTKVNGSKIAGEKPLRDGDSIAVGPVVLAFVAPRRFDEDEPTRLEDMALPPFPDEDLDFPTQDGLPPTRTAPVEPPAPASQPVLVRPPVAAPDLPIEAVETRLVSAGEIAAAASEAISASETVLKMPAVSLPPSESAIVPAPRSDGPGGRGMARRGASPLPIEEETTAGKGRSVALVRGKSPASRKGDNAVERARRKREAGDSLGKLLAYHWLELSLRARVVLSVMGALILLVGVAVLVLVFRPPADHGAPVGPEPSRIGPRPLTASFGLGPDVTWEEPDRKIFHFIFSTPTRAVAVLHYQASDISADEVSITLNGTAEGSVPADTDDVDERDLEQVLPPQALRKNKDNELVFDDLHNPPKEDPWKIWNIWLEVIPIPELPKRQLEASARAYMARARQFYDQRDVGASNLFLSWKNYRLAWLTLEALNDHSDLYREARFELAKIGKALDEKCGGLMLSARRAVELNHPDEARNVLESVSSYFPTTEQRCHNLALERLSEYGL